jgi:hypothetical protein
MSLKSRIHRRYGIIRRNLPRLANDTAYQLAVWMETDGRREPAKQYLMDARAENEYAHSEGAHR